MSETIEYRGHKINVGWYREQYASFKKDDGTAYFTQEELETQVQKRVLEEKRHIGRITGARFDKHNGFRLAFYQNERQKFPQAFETKVTDSEAKKIVQKLVRHFKLRSRKISIRLYANRQSGACGSYGIRISHNASIGLICHEVAHLKHKKHTKIMVSFMSRLINYCTKKGWMQHTTDATKGITNITDITDDSKRNMNETTEKTQLTYTKQSNRGD